MATSTINTFTTGLLANLQKRTGLNGVSITDGPPPVGVKTRAEWIMLADVDGTQEFHAINAVTKPKNEVYTLEVWIDVVQASRNDQATVNARAFTLLAEIENELRANPQQGVNAIRWSGIHGPVRVQKRANDQMRECCIVVGIEVHARI